MHKTISSGSKHFVMHQLAEGIYAAIAKDLRSDCNSGIVDLGGQIVIFDTFLTPQAAMDLRQMAEVLVGRTPQIVVNSHYHNDHIWGNQVFAADSQIISSACTRELIATAGMEELQWYSANSAQRLETLQSQYQNTDDEQQRSQQSMWIGFYEAIVESIPHLSVCKPSITFNNRLQIHGSKHTAELITFEGAHTGSDTVLHLPREGIIFMSDLLFVSFHPYLADGDPFQLLKALKELSQLNATCFVPGHGPVGKIDDVQILIEYVEHCLETAQIIIKEGSAYEDRIADLKIAESYKHWQVPQFYQANIRFLCQLLNSASGDNSIH